MRQERNRRKLPLSSIILLKIQIWDRKDKKSLRELKNMKQKVDEETEWGNEDTLCHLHLYQRMSRPKFGEKDIPKIICEILCKS